MKQTWFERNPNALTAARAMLADRYPTLHATQEGRIIAVGGSFAITHEGADVDWYQLKVMLPDDYPSSPPAVFEMGGRIPRIRDRHVNPDGTLCLGVREDLWVKWSGRFDIAHFLEEPVRTFLIGNSLVEQGKPWPYGERPHGASGIYEFYKETLGFGEPAQVRALLQYLVKERIKGHWPCPCGSGKELRRCHAQEIRELHAKIPSNVFKQSLANLLSEEALPADSGRST